MTILHFSAYNPDGVFKELSYAADDLDTGLDLLSDLARARWQLVSAQIWESTGQPTQLPIEAFDGQFISNQLRKLQHEWEAVLEAYF